MGVIVHHRADIGPRLKDAAMDRALAVHDAAALVDRVAVEVEFHDVVARHQFRAARARHEEAVGPLRMPQADMAEAVDHALVRQDPVGDHQILEMLLQRRHRFLPKRVFSAAP